MTRALLGHDEPLSLILRTMFASRTDWPLTPNRLSEAVTERRRTGAGLLDLTESNPTRCGFEYPTSKILAALAQERALTYRPEPRGLASARAAVASYYAERGIEAPLTHIVLSASTSEAYTWVFRLLANPGESVLVPQPSYPLFHFLGGLNDVELVPYPLTYRNGWHIDRGGLDSALRSTVASASKPRAILVVHPNNPTGSFVSREELAFLVSRCRRYELALIGDEVFADYAFDAEALFGRLGGDDAPVLSHADVREVLTFTLSGLSKVTALPQMKIAWLVVSGPRDEAEAALERLEIIADTYLSVSTPVAEALPNLLGTRRPMQAQILERLRRNLQSLDAVLTHPLEWRRLQAHGGWYAVLARDGGSAAPNDAVSRAGVPGPSENVRSDEDLAVDLVSEEGVLVHPGHFYDFTTDGHLIISLLPPVEVFEEGVRRVAARLKRR